MNTINCARALERTWKRMFGLGTEYAGYLTPDQAQSLMSVRRFGSNYINWDDDDSFTVENLNRAIKEINSVGINMNYIPSFSFTRRVENEGIVIHDLLKTVSEFDLSEASVIEDEWNQFIQYIQAKK